MNFLRPFQLQKNVAVQFRKLMTSPTKFGKPRFASTFCSPTKVGNARFVSPSLIGFATATSLALILPQLSSKHAIRNDTILGVKQRHDMLPEEVGLPSQRKSSLGRKLNYRQLCLGSIIGLVAGVLVGKISTVLVFVTACGLLGIQWLENRGLVDKKSTIGLSKYMIKTGKDSVDLNTLVWEKPSFKVPFLLTFVLAAINI
ncbi:LANO_0D08966g1_1 [Lachancea nothofagi CBS 11611]|uniref:LANO_0D08966g1_1 n=1 Tax=Lachancea nothofagi CBS 11611 TaxID=1266666 RepID=A0A1G4JJ43_9SACH|nr:LANO_0D08966g1_1 [Lachancea nothofagi CBS 11611]